MRFAVLGADMHVDYVFADIGELDEDALVEDGSAIQARSPRRGSTSTSMFDRKFAKLTAKDEKDRKAQIDLQMQQEEILIQVNVRLFYIFGSFEFLTDLNVISSRSKCLRRQTARRACARATSAAS